VVVNIITAVPDNEPDNQYESDPKYNHAYLFLISLTKIQISHKPPVRHTIRQSPMNFQKPYFLRCCTYTFIITP
jgi:hypothetical protein